MYNTSMTNNMTNEMTSEYLMKHGIYADSEFFIATVNAWFITIRCAGSGAEYYMAKKQENGRVLVKTSKSLSYIKNACK